MLPNKKFENLDLEFWANIKLLNQRLGYTERKSKKNPTPGFVIPSQEQIERVFKDDPKELTAITQNKFPIRTLSRRVDGAFPSVIDPRAIWEIKEYYYTTTFGSRVADGVYETQLDGWELWEAETNLGTDIKHYLIIDDYFTWWTMGRSYLCRLIDSMHMGLVTEVIFGREVIDRIPELVEEWISYGNDKIYSLAAEP